MSQTLHDMAATLRGMVHVSGCVQLHPWLVTGSAVAIGCVAGAALTPSRHEKSRSNLETNVDTNCQGREPVQARKSFLLSTLGAVLTGILIPLVRGALAEIVVAKDLGETPSPDNSAGVAASEPAME